MVFVLLRPTHFLCVASSRPIRVAARGFSPSLCRAAEQTLYVLAQCFSAASGAILVLSSLSSTTCPHLLFDPSFSLDRQRQGLYTFTIRHCVQPDTHLLGSQHLGTCCPASATSFIHIQVPSRPGCLGLLLCRGWAPLDGMVSRTCSLWERRGVCVPPPPEPSPPGR